MASVAASEALPLEVGCGVWLSSESNSDWWSLAFFSAASWLQAPMNHLILAFHRFNAIDERSSEMNGRQAFFSFCLRLCILGVAVAFTHPISLLLRDTAIFLQKGGFNWAGAASKEVGRSIRCLSFNICTFPGNWNERCGGVRESGWERLERLVELFKREDPDVICLQEVFDPAFAKALKERLAQEGWSLSLMNAGPPTSFGIITSGLFVASRVAVTQARYIELQPSFAGELPRGALQMEIGGVDLLVTHLSPSAFDKAPTGKEIEARRSQRLQIATCLRARPTALIGDFNAESKEFCSIGDLEEEVVNKPTCTEAFTERYCAEINGIDNPVVEENGAVLDRLMTKNLRVTDFQVVKSFSSIEERFPLSDHHALFVELTID